MSDPARKISFAVLIVTALIIVGLVFFDVIFLDRTLQPSNIVPRMGKPAEWQASSAVFHVFNPETIASDGFADLNASAWEFEPARYLMARNIREGQSLWWNPYSASGTLGPEVLVDIKFSPHTLISAWLFDASPTSFDFGLIIIYVIGVFFVLLILRHIFQLSWLAALAGAIVYLLNGFAIPNLNTHVGQPYFFSPILMFSVLFFAQRQSFGRWFFLVLVHAILLTICILTTLSLVLITVHLLGIFFFFSVFGCQRSSLSGALYYCSMVAAAVVAGMMLVGPLWFPIIDSFFVTDMVTDFDSRALQKPRNIENFLSVFSPKHFWENYSHILRVNIYPDSGLEKSESLIAHMGIVSAFLAGYGLCRQERKWSLVAWICLFLIVFSYARIFGFAGFVSHVPIIRSIGNQYWGCMSSIALFILVSFGVQNVQRGNICGMPIAVVLMLQIASFLLLYKKLGFPEVFPYSLYVWVAISVFVFSIISVLVIHRRWLNYHGVALLMVVVMLAELLFYMNPIRPFRYSPIDRQPDFINFLKKNIGDGRVLNIGQNNTLYPEYGSMFGIKQADTQNPGLFPWYESFFDRNFGNDTFMFLALDGSSEKKRKKTALKDYVLDEASLDVASIKYILVADASEPYLNFLHEKNYPVVYKKEGLSIFENVDYVHSASLEPLSNAVEVNARHIDGSVSVESYRNAEVIVRTETNSPARLVLSDTWHPAWKASVDGRLVEVERVHEAFRGVALPAGQHRVRVYYDLPALRYGVYAMAFAVSIMSLLLLLSCRRKIRKAYER